MSWAGITIRVQTAHARDDLVALVTPTANQQKSALITVGVSYLWNRPGTAVRDGDRIRAHVDVYTTWPHVDDPYCDIDGPYLAVKLTGTVGVGTGQSRSLAEIACDRGAGLGDDRSSRLGCDRPASRDRPRRDLVDSPSTSRRSLA